MLIEGLSAIDVRSCLLLASERGRDRGVGNCDVRAGRLDLRASKRNRRARVGGSRAHDDDGVFGRLDLSVLDELLRGLRLALQVHGTRSGIVH